MCTVPQTAELTKPASESQLTLASRLAKQAIKAGKISKGHLLNVLRAAQAGRVESTEAHREITRLLAIVNRPVATA